MQAIVIVVVPTSLVAPGLRSAVLMKNAGDPRERTSRYPREPLGDRGVGAT